MKPIISDLSAVDIYVLAVGEYRNTMPAQCKGALIQGVMQGSLLLIPDLN